MRSLSLLLCLASVLAFAKNKSEPFPIGANPEAVKKAVLAQAVAEGYRVENDSQFQLVLTKDMNQVGAGFTVALLSPSACTGVTPRYLFTVILVPSQQGTDVTAHYDMEYAGSLCRPVRSSQDKQHKKFFEEFMAKVKAASESQQSNAAGKP